jgi:hypothetical protein
MPIPMKREINGRSGSLLPMTDPGKRMKRGFANIQALISQETALVSRHFRFRFTVRSIGERQRTNSERPLFVRSLYCFGASEAASF